MTCNSLPDSYQEAHRYDGAVLQHDQRDQIEPCPAQPRDVAIVDQVRRLKFLTSTQLLELWWSERSAWAGQRRLLRLFAAGYLERFRPYARGGSYPWVYHLGEQGHRLLQDADLVDRTARFRRRVIYDYGHVLHDLQLNAWVLACQRALGQALVSWGGEIDVKPPRGTRPQLRLGDNWTAEGLRNPTARLLRPDAVLEIATSAQQAPRTFFVEYDRTRRLDKNYDKFRRYDAFLTWWWRHTSYADLGAPYVLFICQDAEHRNAFLSAADRELNGHCWHPSARTEQIEYPGRRQILFALEHEAHAGVIEAWRLPAFPAGHKARSEIFGRIRFASSP
jgi:hypothetical protein